MFIKSACLSSPCLTNLLFNFEAKPELIAELERNYRITDEVIKFIVVRKEN